MTRPSRSYRRDLKHLAVWPRRLGEVALLAAAVVGIGLPWNGIHDVAGYSPAFLGVMLGLAGVGLIVFTIWIRRRYRHHHEHVAAERGE